MKPLHMFAQTFVYYFAISILLILFKLLFGFWQVEMKDVRDAKFIESLISQNDMRAFVCSNRDDLKLFLAEVHLHVYNIN